LKMDRKGLRAQGFVLVRIDAHKFQAEAGGLRASPFNAEVAAVGKVGKIRPAGIGPNVLE